MADDRNSYKGQTITLELHESDVSGSISSVDRVFILQDKEICYSTNSISLISPGVWSITVQTNDVLYSGNYHDRWVLNGGYNWVEKNLTITEMATAIPNVQSANLNYYAKDLTWIVQNDGELQRYYNEYAIVGEMQAVIMTPMGALFNEPTYGSNLYNFLFSTSPSIAEDIRRDVQMQLQSQVQNIKIDQVIVKQEDYNSYSVSVHFYNIASSNPNELMSMVNLVSVEQIF